MPAHGAFLLDLSDAGVTRDVNGFIIESSGSVLLTFDRATTVPSIGSVDDSDIVRFIPTSTGAATSGTFELVLDGSDVDLTTNGEDIDSLALLPDGRLVVSFIGTARVNGTSLVAAG